MARASTGTDPRLPRAAALLACCWRDEACHRNCPQSEYKRRFGEPLPALFTLPSVAQLVTNPCTCAGVAARLTSKYNVAPPETCGADMEVPDFTAVAVSLVHQADLISRPGANKSTQVP